MLILVIQGEYMVFASKVEDPRLFLAVTERIDDVQDAWGIFRTLQTMFITLKKESSSVLEQAENLPRNRDQEWAMKLIQGRKTWY